MEISFGLKEHNLKEAYNFMSILYFSAVFGLHW